MKGGLLSSFRPTSALYFSMRGRVTQSLTWIYAFLLKINRFMIHESIARFNANRIKPINILLIISRISMEEKIRIKTVVLVGIVKPIGVLGNMYCTIQLLWATIVVGSKMEFSIVTIIKRNKMNKTSMREMTNNFAALRLFSYSRGVECRFASSLIPFSRR